MGLATQVAVKLPLAENRIGQIPIRNVWLLMLYASELFKIQGTAAVDLEKAPDELPDLLAELLSHLVEVRLRRHLSLGFQTKSAPLNRLRGQIDVLATERARMLDRGLIQCRFIELTIDTPRNRFVRAALETISTIVTRNELSHRCRKLANELKAFGVLGPTPSRAEMSREQFGRHDTADQAMVAAAKLAFDLLLPTESMGTNKLPLASREEHWVRKLFERAIGGFYEVVLNPNEWRVYRGATLNWKIDHKTPGIDRILPGMKSDIILDNNRLRSRIVIDTKFTSILRAGWYRDVTLKSAYMYQMYSYLMSQTGRGDRLADHATGLLLHPSIEETVDETVSIQGHAIRFATVDLTAESAEFRKRLLSLCETWERSNHTWLPVDVRGADGG